MAFLYGESKAVGYNSCDYTIEESRNSEFYYGDSVSVVGHEGASPAIIQLKKLREMGAVISNKLPRYTIIEDGEFRSCSRPRGGLLRLCLPTV